MARQGNTKLALSGTVTQRRLSLFMATHLWSKTTGDRAVLRARAPAPKGGRQTKLNRRSIRGGCNGSDARGEIRVQYIFRSQIKEDKSEEFRAWVLENHDLIAEHAPEGWTYLGTWFTVLRFGRYDAESRWELADYGALGAGFGDETMQRLLLGWWAFLDMNVAEAYLMKNAREVDILE